MFFTSYDTINALRKQIKLFEDKGFYTICCKNVTVAEKEIVVICIYLSGEGSLPDEAMIDLLSGLKNVRLTSSCSKSRQSSQD